MDIRLPTDRDSAQGKSIGGDAMSAIVSQGLSMSMAERPAERIYQILERSGRRFRKKLSSHIQETRRD
jgi:hypothetical protein